MCRKVFLFLLLASGLCVRAQYSGYKLLTDANDFKAKFTAASQKTNTIKSDFVQEKELSMLSEKIVSKGKFWFKRENAVRMEYTTPFQYLMIINNGKIYIKDSQKENKISAKSNKLFEQVNKIMMDCVNGSALSNPDFTTRIFEGSGSYLVELSPVNKSLKNLFKNINLVVGKKDYAVSKIEMHEPSGDNTTINYINREMNVSLPDALFAIN
ncbi:MAG: outer membrane lipoprotein carrier protein LolA [Bacteroidetes bacterium]|nr:outer membrane lipoprotein carrier protein LolA [Bacteroidota bacterium]